MSVTQKWVSEQLNDLKIGLGAELRAEMRQLLTEQYEKIGQLLIKHFYTKDETDRKFAQYYTRDDMDGKLENLKSYIGVQVESLRSDFRAGLEGISLHSQKLDNHETRITKLEDQIF